MFLGEQLQPAAGAHHQEARAGVGGPVPGWETLLRKTGLYDAALAIGAQTARIRDFAAIPPAAVVKCIHDDASGPVGNGNVVQTPAVGGPNPVAAVMRTITRGAAAGFFRATKHWDAGASQLG